MKPLLLEIDKLPNPVRAVLRESTDFVEDEPGQLHQAINRYANAVTMISSRHKTLINDELLEGLTNLHFIAGYGWAMRASTPPRSRREGSSPATHQMP